MYNRVNRLVLPFRRFYYIPWRSLCESDEAAAAGASIARRRTGESLLPQTRTRNIKLGTLEMGSDVIAFV